MKTWVLELINKLLNIEVSLLDKLVESQIRWEFNAYMSFDEFPKYSVRLTL